MTPGYSSRCRPESSEVGRWLLAFFVGSVCLAVVAARAAAAPVGQITEFSTGLQAREQQ